MLEYKPARQKRNCKQSKSLHDNDPRAEDSSASDSRKYGQHDESPEILNDKNFDRRSAMKRIRFFRVIERLEYNRGA